MIDKCPNCEGENAKTGYVENWGGVCPDCNRKIIEQTIKKWLFESNRLFKELSYPKLTEMLVKNLKGGKK